MNLRKFRKPTVSEALREAREALGPDAFVLSTEMVPVSGWRGWMGAREVQLTAAIDPQVSEPRPPAPERRLPVTDPLRASLVARLLAGGLDRPVAESVARAIPDEECRGASANRILRALAAEVSALVATDQGFARAEVFVGPPGVGKTTTIAKIAARERALNGRALGVVAADGFRAGAVEQLRVYADIIGTPFKVARTAEELDRVLRTSRSTLLVDTAGRSPNDGSVRELMDVVARHRNVRTHLCIAADTSVSTARRIFDTYAEADVHRLIITKIDETDSLAPLAGILQERQLPISYLTSGQRVPEDLERATPALVADAILRDSAEHARA